MNNNQKQVCGKCKHFQDPPFGFPICKKLKTDTTKQSEPKGKNCFEES